VAQCLTGLQRRARIDGEAGVVDVHVTAAGVGRRLQLRHVGAGGPLHLLLGVATGNAAAACGRECPQPGSFHECTTFEHVAAHESSFFSPAERYALGGRSAFPDKASPLPAGVSRTWLPTIRSAASET